MNADIKYDTTKKDVCFFTSLVLICRKTAKSRKKIGGKNHLVKNKILSASKVAKMEIYLM